VHQAGGQVVIGQHCAQEGSKHPHKRLAGLGPWPSVAVRWPTRAPSATKSTFRETLRRIGG